MKNELLIELKNPRPITPDISLDVDFDLHTTFVAIVKSTSILCPSINIFFSIPFLLWPLLFNFLEI